MDINIESQIVVQTSAQWAADNTVYSAKRILVTSDANWDNTDQRKFKIADGTQTWSQLDYPPIGYETMTTSAGEFKFAKTTAGAVLLWTNGQDMRFSASVGGSPAFILKTDGTIVLENGTANKFLKTGASKEITLVDNPVDVNTIGSAINGAASATPNDTDLVMSVDTSVAKKSTWTQVKAFLKTYFDTVYQATGTYLTSANITQVITNGVTDKAPSEDAVYDALALKANNSLYLTNTSSSTTGDTNENILYSSNNLTGLFSINSVVRFLIQYAGTSSANTKTIKIYVGTSSNSLVGATQLATYTFTTNTGLQKGLVRNMRILSALTSNEIIASVTNGLDNDETALSSNASITSIGFDFGGASIYFHITGQNSNSGETITLRHSRAELIK